MFDKNVLQDNILESLDTRAFKDIFRLVIKIQKSLRPAMSSQIKQIFVQRTEKVVRGEDLAKVVEDLADSTENEQEV